VDALDDVDADDDVDAELDVDTLERKHLFFCFRNVKFRGNVLRLFISKLWELQLTPGNSNPR